MECESEEKAAEGKKNRREEFMIVITAFKFAKSSMALTPRFAIDSNPFTPC